MKLDSKYFDRIRIKPLPDRETAKGPACEWPGCKEKGTYMAPKGRGYEGQYFHYCLHHVREYNRTYNYFAGMSSAEFADYLKASATGHRPTWTAGVNAWAQERLRQASRAAGNPYNFETVDPFGLFNDAGLGSNIKTERRPLRNAERKCLRTLNLDETATAQDIKANYKMLVKLHHPDRHGGDRSSEEKLREVINAYNYLKQAGLC